MPRDVTVFAIYVMHLLDTNYSCLTFIYSVVGDDEAIEVQVEDCDDEAKDSVLCNCLCQQKLHFLNNFRMFITVCTIVVSAFQSDVHHFCLN